MTASDRARLRAILLPVLDRLPLPGSEREELRAILAPAGPARTADGFPLAHLNEHAALRFAGCA